MKKIFLFLFLSVIFSTTLCFSEEKLPNILLVISDDQRFDDLDEYMPYVKKEIFDKGLRFNKAYVTTPLCCPSRASIYTGLYASKHGVYSNQIPLKKETIIQKLHKQKKYYTGLVGKYLNSSDGSPRPEFDFWVSHKGAVRYRNPELNINGVWGKKKGYQTDLLTEQALSFLDLSSEKKKPFFLTLSYFAPHSPTVPHKKDSKKFLNTFISTPEFNEVDVSDKPSHIRENKLYSLSEVKALKSIRIKQRQALSSIDRSLKKVLTKLTEQQKIQDTIIIYLSDNGILLGEHRLWGKRYIYEPAIKIPFAIRYDKKFTPKSINDLVLNIDIAPTLLELSKTKIPDEIDGHSLLRLVDRKSLWRKAFLFEVFQMHSHQNPSFSGIHTGNFVFAWHKLQSKPYELYDLKQDPAQLRNIAYDEKHQALLEKLKNNLYALIKSKRGKVALEPPTSVLNLQEEAHVENFKSRKRLLRLGR